VRDAAVALDLIWKKRRERRKKIKKRKLRKEI
jgi:hypothetical protein